MSIIATVRGGVEPSCGDPIHPWRPRQRRSHRVPSACDIWISSGVRGAASRLRKFSGFGRLDFLGIPWILSTETSLFNGLRASAGDLFSSCGPFPFKAAAPCDDGVDPLPVRLALA